MTSKWHLSILIDILHCSYWIPFRINLFPLIIYVCIFRCVRQESNSIRGFVCLSVRLSVRRSVTPVRKSCFWAGASVWSHHWGSGFHPTSCLCHPMYIYGETDGRIDSWNDSCHKIRDVWRRWHSSDASLPGQACCKVCLCAGAHLLHRKWMHLPYKMWLNVSKR